MKYRTFLPVLVCLCCFLSSTAQVNTAGKSYLDNVPNSHPDSIEVAAFKRLLIFITTESVSWKKSDINLDSLSKIGESHFLYSPFQTIPGQYQQDNTSYDNFLPTVYHKDLLEGSPFFLPAYVPGLVVNQLDSVIDNKDYLYNYDKKSENLLLKRGDEAPIAVNRNQVKYFCLKPQQGGYIFERVLLISPDEYFQVLYKGSKYSFYKQIKSIFIPANQKTNGYSRSGNDYDEYQDQYSYYIVDHRKMQVLVFELSKKSLRKSLYAEDAVLEKYFREHKWQPVDEPYLVHLAELVNK